MQSLRDLFLLDPDVTFLNHGSVGATPRPVFDTYRAWQHDLERQPLKFLARELFDHLADVGDASANTWVRRRTILPSSPTPPSASTSSRARWGWRPRLRC